MSITHSEPSGAIHTNRSFIARTIHTFAVPIILFWLAVVVILTVFVPPLEVVGQERSVALSPTAAPSLVALKRIGHVFNEGETDSVALILLEGDKTLGVDAHKFYDAVVRKLRADKQHVVGVQDLWGDPLLAAGSQSNDGKAAYLQVNLAGNQGEQLANDSVDAVRSTVDSTPAPPGVKAYVTGPSALASDLHHSSDKSIAKITLVSVVAIFAMLLLVYRSLPTVILLLLTVGVELSTARGVVALLAHGGLVGLSAFAVSLLTSLAIAAGTDYGIFLFGRYQEARQAGEDREAAFHTMYRGTAHVILGSGITIAAATLCLSFARMPYFQTLGIPCAVGMLVAVLVALTLGPAVLAVGSRFGLCDPKRRLDVRGWRRVGTVVVRWPLPVLALTCAVALVGLISLPGYRPSYDDRAYLPSFIPANQGLAIADRHFPQARMKPEVLMLESDHDLRNPTDFLILDKLAKGIFHVQGISRVQAITRPDGATMDHTSIPFQLSMQNAGIAQDMKFQRDRMDDMRKQADEMGKTVATMQRMYDLMMQLAANTHRVVADTEEMQQITDDLRDRIADFDDFWRPIRSYFYWERHCYDVAICWSVRSMFDAVDGVDRIDEKLNTLVADVKGFDRLMPEMIAQLPPMIETMANMRTMMLTLHSTMSGIFNQMDDMTKHASAMGRAFDGSKNDDSFYLPPEVFENADFRRAMSNFLSPDGHAARFIILHRGDPASDEGIASIDTIRTAAEESLKGTPLESSKIYVAGIGAVFKDISQGAKWDLVIAGISSLCLIFIIMLVFTRALVPAGVIVGTVAMSLGASFGLSVLVWQYILGTPLHWLVLAMSVIVLLAVGSDYNLLLVSRFRQEIHAGLNTGIIRSMGGTGKVVTNAGLVFAFTMASMIVSDVKMIGQLGTTIGLGLLFDTLIVRAFMTPSIAALLGRWFWWPIRVRSRPARRSTVPVQADPSDRSLVPQTSTC
ncbi:siderophore exporter MmpL4 [Mycobacterium montefiorense]|uniref:Siderophore exporter MmpL4 n=1 Tax=Mycobacterium montefiorense TaxID=154654 RepID=A0AA37PS74_9MYCO|nr:Siderophore exporter MmpL4 [Mycobacterium montefiorense]GKU37498.1 siderophore exporter MmpL4 [Mycobacterium montefiorense]GKU42634.1 siderophore exporter MmpL4 [Mycobacterium montefiorense]GKU48688.1 siderophore exporter MmpL4 [Mycobacterium montefiorense]GKU50713.1 siderophore exporter MmpL4 [Mycobacterium montefiorense]